MNLEGKTMSSIPDQAISYCIYPFTLYLFRLQLTGNLGSGMHKYFECAVCNSGREKAPLEYKGPPLLHLSPHLLTRRIALERRITHGDFEAGIPQSIFDSHEISVGSGMSSKSNSHALSIRSVGILYRYGRQRVRSP